jgi:hypothetical protein
MTAKLGYRWNLRQVMASRGMFATTDLADPLAQRGVQLSSSQIYRLVVERPERLSLKVLMALLDILGCATSTWSASNGGSPRHSQAAISSGTKSGSCAATRPGMSSADSDAARRRVTPRSTSSSPHANTSAPRCCSSTGSPHVACPWSPAGRTTSTSGAQTRSPAATARRRGSYTGPRTSNSPRWIHPAAGGPAPASRWTAKSDGNKPAGLLHDDTISTEDRVASLLVLFYAQWTSAVARLTMDQITVTDAHVTLHLGAEPILLPDPLAGLVRAHLEHRRRHPVTGPAATAAWLFPGELPGRPISGNQLGQRLRRLGLRPRQARSTALFQLATELPAAVLARMLGIHISSAVAWQRASNGDWAAYAAHVGIRTTPTPDRTPP